MRLLDALGIPYAKVGAMALNEFGYQRTTVAVDVLLTLEGLATFKASGLGRGYVEKFALLPLATLLELKLASGMTAPHRLKDLADVQEVIRIQRLPRDLGNELNSFVRDKCLELWQSVQDHPEGQE